MPEFKSLLLGLVFALGTFSIKSGCGAWYVLKTRPTLFGKSAAFVIIALVYFGLFAGSWHFCKTADLVSLFNRLKGFFESGMVLHVLMAGGTLLWAISLLKQHGASEPKSLGWLALVAPCPVCASAVFFITGFLVAFFPDRSFTAVLGAYAVYLVLTVLTFGLVSLWTRHADSTPERALGSAMLFVSAYFLFAILVTPHFTDIEKIYRIAASGSKVVSGHSNGTIVIGVMSALSFVVGVVITRIRTRR